MRLLAMAPEDGSGQATRPSGRSISGSHEGARAAPRVTLPFADRRTAGQALAAALVARHLELVDPIVLALPRGGVPVAVPVAHALQAPLDLLLVRKIGAPGQPELAIAALVDGTPPEIVIDRDYCALTGADDSHIARQAREAIAENERRRLRYLGGRAAPALAGRTVIVVDDGVATGTTMRAALQALRKQQPLRLIGAVPVASREASARLREQVDVWVCLAEPVPFEAVGRHYVDFGQVDDEQVVHDLAAAAAPGEKRARSRAASPAACPASPSEAPR
jgi:putative phosphoribosyl transferase